jgi:alkanesulfonate monooxygenase SsuD/methylene tetrahydromethanopterin reductase-like flavin-dependent oxidoreductase (luciferase family)
MDEAFHRSRTALHSDNTLKLGLFGANCSSANCVTDVEERWSGTWDDNLQLAQMADEAGIDFMLPIGRWKGYGGATDFQGTTLETLTWAAGLLAATKRITVFGTVHAPLFHPVIAAKQMVTADHIGHGRFGLNVVCGWNEDEFEMFGVAQRGHESRYEQGEEWIRALDAMWARDDDFDVDGSYITLKDVRSKPKPYRGTRPIVMNAAHSPAGRAFALRNCDALFVTTRFAENLDPVAADVRDVQAGAAAIGRAIDVYTTSFVTCRPTRREAEEYLHYCVEERADWGAIDAFLRLKGLLGQPPDQLAETRRKHPMGLIGWQAVGTPDDVARSLADFSAAGLRGVALSMVNFAAEFPYFRDEVLPRLERLGLRSGRPGD